MDRYFNLRLFKKNSRDVRIGRFCNIDNDFYGLVDMLEI